MTIDELDEYLDKNKEFISYVQGEDDSLLIKDNRYNYYRNDGNYLKVELKKLQEMSVAELEKEIGAGLKVEHITRVTGYFAKTNSFNPGKKGELRDRYKKEGGI